MPKEVIRVVAAVIEHEGRYLITQRNASAVLPLLWEFPGGRVEPHETDEVALEKVTYEWGFHYFEGLQDNQLVLTPPKATERDGKPGGGNSQFPSSYLLSTQSPTEFRY